MKLGDDQTRLYQVEAGSCDVQAQFAMLTPGRNNVVCTMQVQEIFGDVGYA